jgi:DNA mismatch repair protein MutS2
MVMEGIYPENFEIKVGFDRIREMIKNHCISSLGEEQVDDMTFWTSFETIRSRLGETDEFLRIIREFPQFPSNHYFDVRNALNNIRLEGRFMEVEELFDLKRALETLKSIVSFFHAGKEVIFPNLFLRVRQIRMYPFVNERIDIILNKFGKIRDRATPELARIRNEISTLQAGISRKLQHILKQAQQEGWAEEGASVAIRDGRAVIPVSAANKRKLRGIVYDESATGKTSYIEPAEIVELNNEIRQLEYAERREIIRILTQFSNDIRPYIDDLIASNELLGELDFIRAKALLAQEFKAIKPDFSDRSSFSWKQAVHPLLMISLRREKREIVPLDIFLNEDQHVLLISGPNAGGKSVCLKTVGLLQYMLQCGLLIPIQEGSKTGIFRQIFIDIGDEQSIENDLSTYSSHLLNMKHFLKNSDEKTLILIDEFGSGTEPMLGGAIAEAILNRLNQQKAYGIITTHYTNLKHFATSASGIMNGAMLYDSQKMNPLFVLEIGKPGSSFAFEIARKIGLPEFILQEATEKIGKKQIDFDKNLRSITRDKFYWETKRQKIKKVEKTVDEIAGTYEKELKEISQQRKEILKKAKEEAQALLAGVNKQIENTIREIREAQADKPRTKETRGKLELLKKEIEKTEIPEENSIARKMEKLRKKERERKKEINGNKDIDRNKETKSGITEETGQIVPEKPELKAGDNVKISGQDMIGELIDFNEKNAVIAFGQLISTVPLGTVERISASQAVKAEKKKGRSGLAMTLDFSERRMNFKSDIDLRGVRAEEAIGLIQNVIDEAIMFEVGQLRILHGKGYGILKEVIRNYLRTEPMVKSFRDEDVRFGGAGITVVELGV